MDNLLDTLINGPARYTEAHHLSPVLTIVVIISALLAEFVLAYAIALALVRFIQNIPLSLGFILRKCGVGGKEVPKVFLELTFPAQTGKSAFATEQLHILLRNQTARRNFWEKLAAPKVTHSMEIVSTREGGVRYIMAVPHNEVDYIERSLRSYLPGLKIRQREDYISKISGTSAAIVELRLSSDFVLPLQDHSTLKEHDPIGYLTGQMTKLAPKELVALQLVVTPVLSSTHRRSLRHLNKIQGRIKMGKTLSSELKTQRSAHGQLLWMLWFPPLWFIAMMGQTIATLTGIITSLFSRDHELPDSLTTNGDKRRAEDPYETELGKTIKTKLDQQLFEASIRIFVASPNTEHIVERLNALADAFEPFSSRNQAIRAYRSLNIPFIDIPGRQMTRFKNRTLSPHLISQQTIIASSELSDLYHFPNPESANTENVIKSLSKTLPATVSLKNGTELDVVLGMNKHHDTDTPIGLTADERERHVYIVGGTGNGKTTMLQYAATQDIQNGKGIALVDPHGDFAETLLKHVPESRLKDVIYFNPSDISYPVGLNLLEQPSGLSKDELLLEQDFITESIVSIFRKIFSTDEAGGHRIEHILRNAIHTAFTVPDATLFTIYKLLTNTKFRNSTVSKLKDEDLIDFWKGEFNTAGDYQKVKMSAGVNAKLGRFQRSVVSRRILEQPKSTIDFDDIIQNKKILICNFSKGQIGEDTSALLGISVLAKLQLAALKRSRMNSSERSPFYLYVDEFQNFATTSFLQMLSEARKYKMFLTMAEQSTAQLEDHSMLDTILANVGTVICFRSGSPADENYLLSLFSPYVDKGEIANLPSYNFYAKIAAGQTQEPMSGETVLLEETGSDTVAQAVRTYSRKHYARKYKEKVPDGLSRPSVKGAQLAKLGNQPINT